MTDGARARGGALGYAARALWREVAGFRFRYDAADVPGAEQPGALPFHLDSPRLFAEAMRLDADGVPYQVSRTFTSYNPAYVAWYGLQQLQDAELRGAPGGRERFLAQVRWLRERAVERADGAAVWPYDFDWREGEAVLRAGWISGMAQGLAISALVRAHRLGGDAQLLALAQRAARPFALSIAEGGVSVPAGRGVIFEEYPALPPPRVLDGSLFALLGLYDLVTEAADARLAALLAAGLDGLESELAGWDFGGRWSWYGRRLYLSPPHYHGINRALLLALARASGRPAFAAMARGWDPARLGARDRVAVYLAFVATKQWSRVRDRLVARRLRTAG